MELCSSVNSLIHFAFSWCLYLIFLQPYCDCFDCCTFGIHNKSSPVKLFYKLYWCLSALCVKKITSAFTESLFQPLSLAYSSTFRNRS